MHTPNTISRRSTMYKLITAVLGVGAAIALPQLVHAVGVLTGSGAQLGSALLPMHLPVLLAGFLGGPAAGCIAGILSPLLSCAISGMPAVTLLPFMVAELGTYGLTAGLLSGVHMNRFCKLLIVQIAGRAVRALAMLAAMLFFGNTAITLGSIGAFITAGIAGILLQWALIPLLTDRLERLK